jgi:hypothetical protein
MQLILDLELLIEGHQPKKMRDKAGRGVGDNFPGEF